MDISIDECKAKRIGLDMTQLDLAGRMYVTKQQVSLIEKGKARAASNNYYRLAIDELWNSLPEKEKIWRYECGRLGIYPNRADSDLMTVIKRSVEACCHE